MNTFNRVIMAILTLVLIAFSIIAIINIFISMFNWSTIADRVITFSKNMSPYISVIILFLILIIALIIFIWEVYRRKISHANISTDQSGKTMVIIKFAAMQIRESLNNIQGMTDPKVKVIPRNDGIIINIFSKLIIGINVVDKTKEIRQTASNFALNNLGFKVLQTNYTVTGFIAKKVKEEKPKVIRVIKDEVTEDVRQEEQSENRLEY
ncbi:MAG: hypothetical protein ACXWFB_11605 [Nitrososphaeraceae archaeon]